MKEIRLRLHAICSHLYDILAKVKLGSGKQISGFQNWYGRTLTTKRDKNVWVDKVLDFDLIAFVKTLELYI